MDVDLVDWLDRIAEYEVPIDNNFEERMIYLQRWVKEAPRRRIGRTGILSGQIALSNDNFFTFDGGDKIIDRLENVGKFAERFLIEILEYTNEDVRAAETRFMEKHYNKTPVVIDVYSISPETGAS